MSTNVILVWGIFTGATVLLGCCNSIDKPVQRTISNPSSNQSPASTETDLISGKWFWATPAIAAAPTKQLAILTRSGDKLTGKVVWELDEQPSGEILNGKIEGSKVSFDAILFVRDVETDRQIKLIFSYRGTLDNTKRLRISGSCTLTANKDGVPTTLEYPWNAFPGP